MSSRQRTNKCPKGPGYDYWTKRLGNHGSQGYGQDVKKHTHRLERRRDTKIAEDARKEKDAD